MTERYSPTGTEAKIDHKLCAAQVPIAGTIHFRQCTRKKKHGDWCTQHHPATEKEQEEEKLVQLEIEAKEAERLARASEKKGYLEAMKDVLKVLDNHPGDFNARGGVIFCREAFVEDIVARVKERESE